MALNRAPYALHPDSDGPGSTGRAVIRAVILIETGIHIQWRQRDPGGTPARADRSGDVGTRREVTSPVKGSVLKAAQESEGAEALVEDGLKPGERGVVYGSDALRDGSRITAR